MGRFLIIAGAALIVAGIVVIFMERAGVRPGSLPGDISVRSPRGEFYFPIVTCLVISAILSVISWLINRR